MGVRSIDAWNWLPSNLVIKISEGRSMTKATNCWLLAALLIVLLTPAAAVAQDSYTVTSLGDGGAWDDPETPTNETTDGICNDGSGQCTLRAALEEAANRGNSVTVIFAVSGTIARQGTCQSPITLIFLEQTGRSHSRARALDSAERIISPSRTSSSVYIPRPRRAMWDRTVRSRASTC